MPFNYLTADEKKEWYTTGKHKVGTRGHGQEIHILRYPGHPICGSGRKLAVLYTDDVTLVTCEKCLKKGLKND